MCERERAREREEEGMVFANLKRKFSALAPLLLYLWELLLFYWKYTQNFICISQNYLRTHTIHSPTTSKSGTKCGGNSVCIAIAAHLYNQSQSRAHRSHCAMARVEHDSWFCPNLKIYNTRCSPSDSTLKRISGFRVHAHPFDSLMTFYL